MGPHPAVAEVRRAVRLALAGSGTVLVACSGGADSLAVAAALAFEAPRAGFQAGLVTIDHGLQDGSDVQAERVAQLGYDLGLDPVEVIRVDVGADGGPEGAARTARYAALDDTAQALDAHVLLGHTLDDQAETVLLGLGRGSGPRSIAGMRAQHGRYLRPLLATRRDTTRAACDALGLDYWDDPHNEDPTFQRVRLRAEVLPLLEQVLQGGVAEALARTAVQLQDDLDALDALAAAELVASEIQQHLTVERLVDLPGAIRTRVLKAWAQSRGADPLSAVHVQALDELVMNWHGQGAVQLPGRVSVLCASGTLSVQPTAAQQ